MEAHDDPWSFPSFFTHSLSKTRSRVGIPVFPRQEIIDPCFLGIEEGVESIGNGIVEEDGDTEEPFRNKIDLLDKHFESEVVAMTCRTFYLLLISKVPIEGPMCDSDCLSSDLYPDLFEEPEVLIETLPFFAREIRCGTRTSLKESSPIGVHSCTHLLAHIRCREA